MIENSTYEEVIVHVEEEKDGKGSVENFEEKIRSGIQHIGENPSEETVSKILNYSKNFKK